MKDKKYLVFGTGGVSKTMAYGDFVIAMAFFALYTRSNKKSDDYEDGETSDEDSI